MTLEGIKKTAPQDSPLGQRLSMADSREALMVQLSQDSLAALALQFASEEMKGDRQVVMTAVSQNGLALCYATEEMKGDRQVVMTAMSENWGALQYATEEMKGDRQIVMTAASRNGYALHFATAELRGDVAMIEHALASADGASLIALRVSLLSGRSCSQIFRFHYDGMEDVLQECAELLGSQHPMLFISSSVVNLQMRQKLQGGTLAE